MTAIHIDDTVDIEYVGDPPVIDEIMRYRMAVGELPLDAAAVLRGAEMDRCTAFPEVDVRVIDPEYFGTSRQYTFGPHTFVTAVERQDVDKILGSSSGHQFRIVGDPMNDVVLPRQPFRFVNDLEVNPAQLRAAIR